MATSTVRPKLRLERMRPAREPSVIVRVAHLSCIECARQLTRALDAQPGVKRAELHYGRGMLSVWGTWSERDVARFVRTMGFVPLALDGAPLTSGRRYRWSLRTRLVLTLLAGLFLLLGYAAEHYAFSWPSSVSAVPFVSRLSPAAAAYGLSMVWGGLFPLRTAMRFLWHGAAETHALIVAVALGAAIIRAPFDGAVVLFVFAASTAIEARCVDRAMHHASGTTPSAATDFSPYDPRPLRLFDSDRFAQYFTPLTAVAAVGALVIPSIILGAAMVPWLHLALMLLLIARPGALVSAVPVAFTAAVNNAEGVGIAVPRSDTWRLLSEVDTVVLYGTDLLADRKSPGAIPGGALSQPSAAAGSGEDGVAAESPVAPRPGSVRAVRRLTRAGRVQRVVLMTEEPEGWTEAVAERFGVDASFARQSPADIARAIGAWRQKGRRVLVVGAEGAASTVMRAGDAAMMLGAAGQRQGADVFAETDAVAHVPYVIALARRAVRAVRRNSIVAVVLKGAAVYFVLSGTLSLAGIAVWEAGSTLFATGAGARLLRPVRLSSRIQGRQ